MGGLKYLPAKLQVMYGVLAVMFEGDDIKRGTPKKEVAVAFPPHSSWCDLSKEPEVQPIKQKSTILAFPYLFGASVIGPLHIQNDIPCQDAYVYEILSSGWGLIAVTDGLGSASKSDI
jgi:hypothetical protein